MVMGKYHSELLMFFNLAFLIKCIFNDSRTTILQIYLPEKPFMKFVTPRDFGKNRSSASIACRISRLNMAHQKRPQNEVTCHSTVRYRPLPPQKQLLLCKGLDFAALHRQM